MVHPLKNVLNKLRWDKREKADYYLITYTHRGAPDDLKRIHASSIRKLGNSYFTLGDESDSEETIIPFHRIIEIRNLQDDSIVWKSRKAKG